MLFALAKPQDEKLELGTFEPERQQSGSGWGGVGRVSRRLALELQGEERLVQGNNFIIFEC